MVPLPPIAFSGAEIQNEEISTRERFTQIWRRDSCLKIFGTLSHFFHPKKTVSGSQESGGRGWEEGWGVLRTWRRSSWTGRQSCHAGLGSSCPSGSSTGERSSLPYPSRLQSRRNVRRSLVERNLRCQNVSSLTLSTVSDSSSECSLSSAQSALTHCGVCGRVHKRCRRVPRLCFASKESLLLSRNSCTTFPLSSLTTGAS